MPAIPRRRRGRDGSQSEVDELSHDLAHWHTVEGCARLERAVQIVGNVERRPHFSIFMHLCESVNDGERLCQPYVGGALRRFADEID
jgi:hypothetical protein